MVVPFPNAARRLSPYYINLPLPPPHSSYHLSWKAFLTFIQRLPSLLFLFHFTSKPTFRFSPLSSLFSLNFLPISYLLLLLLPCFPSFPVISCGFPCLRILYQSMTCLPRPLDIGVVPRYWIFPLLYHFYLSVCCSSLLNSFLLWFLQSFIPHTCVPFIFGACTW